MRAATLLFLATLVAGCATPPAMKLAPALAGIPPSPVNGRQAVLGQGTMSFDRWSSTAPARIPNDRWSRLSPELATGTNETTGLDIERAAIEFAVGAAAGGPQTTVTCVLRGRFARRVQYRGRTTDETTVNIPGYPRIDCEFSGAEAGKLALRPSWLTQRDSGTAVFGARRFVVESVNSTQGSNFPLARFGYQLSVGSRAVAAVETFGTGRVWIDPSLRAREQEQIAVATTALLYYASLLELAED